MEKPRLHAGAQKINSAGVFRPPVASRVAVSALFLLNGILFGTWVSRIPAIQTARGLSHGALGGALLVMALGALLAMPISGRLSAKFGSHWVCRWMAVCYGLLLPVLAVAPGFPLFLAALFCFGVSHGAVDVAMNAQAVVVEKRYRRPIMSSFHALFSIGGLVGASLGGLLAAQGLLPGWHFGIVAVVMIGVAIPGMFPPLLDDREKRDARASQGGLGFAMPTKGLLAAGAIAFCSMLGEGAMADWTGVFLRDSLRASEGLAAVGYAAFSIAMAITRVFGDPLAIRVGPVGLARVSGVFATLGMVLALSSASPVLAIAGFALVGVGFATVVPLAFSAAGRTPGMASGVALATTSTIGYFGFLIGPPVIGFAAEFLGLRGALAIIVFTSALIVVLASAVGVRK